MYAVKNHNGGEDTAGDCEPSSSRHCVQMNVAVLGGMIEKVEERSTSLDETGEEKGGQKADHDASRKAKGQRGGHLAREVAEGRERRFQN